MRKRDEDKKNDHVLLDICSVDCQGGSLKNCYFLLVEGRKDFSKEYTETKFVKMVHRTSMIRQGWV